MSCLLQFCAEEQGQDLIEYSLLMAFLAIACMGFFSAGQDSITGIWSKNTNNIEYASAISK